ncbi:MAG TPA: hypothetical protein VE779_01255 [Candidatus Angelobacter sp.]|nr:hypothetical protein [Candidatus Angelobacter sp.]
MISVSVEGAINRILGRQEREGERKKWGASYEGNQIPEMGMGEAAHANEKQKQRDWDLGHQG